MQELCRVHIKSLLGLIYGALTTDVYFYNFGVLFSGRPCDKIPILFRVYIGATDFQNPPYIKTL